MFPTPPTKEHPCKIHLTCKKPTSPVKSIHPSRLAGIAVGASSLSASLSLSLTVALAICAHKAPVAFGLASFLRTQARLKP